MLTKTELRLLSKLEENAKNSYASLAQNLGINISTVARTMKSMRKNHLFSIHAIPNAQKLGYRARAMIAINIKLNAVDNFCEATKNNFFVSSIYFVYGRFNIVMFTQFPSWDGLHDFISSKLFMSSDIIEIEIFFIRDLIKQNSNPFFKKRLLEEKYLELDEIDQRLMEELSLDGSYTYSYLAHKLGINISQVSRKVSALLKENAFKIIAIPNPTKIKYGVETIIMIRAEHNKLDSICNSLISFKDISTVLTLVNGYNIYLRIATSNQEITNNFIINKVPKLNGVSSIETLILGKIMKQHYRVPLKDHLEICDS
jgi:Lrp/AsnC family transcriptional regulator, regulator for asnA, asnC and gidA